VFRPNCEVIGRKRRALACVRWAEAIPPVPNDAIGRDFSLLLAYVQIKRSEFDQALATLLQKVSRSPYYARDIEYLTYLGMTYEGLGRIDDAIESYITVAGGVREVSVAPSERLVKLYRQRFGSLVGLKEKIEENRLRFRKELYVDSQLLNEPAPDWSLEDIDGREVRLSDFSNKILVLSFARGGGNVDEELLKFLQAQYKKYRDKGVAFVTIDYSPDPLTDDIKTNLQQWGVTIPMLTDRATVISSYGKYSTESLIILIDENGNIRFRNTHWHDYRPFVIEQIEYLLKSKGDR
jgi:peroxiredoxin